MEVGGAGGIRYWPMVAGMPVKSLGVDEPNGVAGAGGAGDTGGGGGAGNVRFLYAGLKQQ
ncbi:MAG TPA: hypothetical protein V6D13_18525 [Halomicronema sp.]